MPYIMGAKDWSAERIVQGIGYGRGQSPAPTRIVRRKWNRQRDGKPVPFCGRRNASPTDASEYQFCAYAILRLWLRLAKSLATLGCSLHTRCGGASE